MRNEPIHEAWQASGHVSKEQELEDYFRDKGWEFVDLAYHHALSEKDCQVLRSIDSIPSLYYRTMPDYFITNGKDSMLVELKVGNSADRAYIEALPLMINQKRETCLLVPTLYVYAGQITEGNMVASPSISIMPNKLVIPKRNKEISPVLTDYFDCPTEERETARGTSGDAFVIVNKSSVKKWDSIDKFIN